MTLEIDLNKYSKGFGFSVKYHTLEQLSVMRTLARKDFADWTDLYWRCRLCSYLVKNKEVWAYDIIMHYKWYHPEHINLLILADEIHKD